MNPPNHVSVQESVEPQEAKSGRFEEPGDGGTGLSVRTVALAIVRGRPGRAPINEEGFENRGGGMSRL